MKRQICYDRFTSATRMICLLWLLNNTILFSCNAQRFLRQGFSNNEDFSSEMKLDDTTDGSNANNAFDMTREMFIIQDLLWQIQSPIPSTSNDNNQLKKYVPNPVIRQHIQKYIQQAPIDIRLLKKRGKYGLRAVGRMGNGKKVRAFWRQSVLPPSVSPPPTTTATTASRGIDFLKASYDDACRSRLFTVEFELQLPPIKDQLLDKKKRNSSSNNNNNILPSIIYQVSLEPGSMNPKAMVPRSAGRVYVLPYGRTTGTSSANNKFEIGKAYVSAAPMKPGIVDPGWAKGRAIFRKGRNSGLM